MGNTSSRSCSNNCSDNNSNKGNEGVDKSLNEENIKSIKDEDDYSKSKKSNVYEYKYKEDKDRNETNIDHEGSFADINNKNIKEHDKEQKSDINIIGNTKDEKLSSDVEDICKISNGGVSYNEQ